MAQAMAGNLRVSPVWDETGENRVMDTNILAYTRVERGLEKILFLGAHIGSGIQYEVRRIRFDIDWHSGRLGIDWRCQIGECNFLMHATITKWDSETWTQQARYSCQQGITDMRVIQRHFSQWMVTTSPRLLFINEVVATDVVGTRKKTDHGGR